MAGVFLPCATAGFRGPILCSESSAKLLPFVLEDTYRLEIGNEPLLVQRFLVLLKRHIESISFAHWHVVSTGLGCIALSACGVLGICWGAYIECEVHPAGKRHPGGLFRRSWCFWQSIAAAIGAAGAG
ncbi:hypothetical protein [Pseudomonas mosselii]|uniref:hypothetical protein n=1 Tax=Pseudomonas mosselii TaxID=78327 RepID=UPI003F373613